jgi:uncharacterized protein (TIGR03086 family)
MADTRDFEVLTRAHSYLGDVVAAVPESAWGAPTPCTEWTVRQVLNHARIDQQGYGLALTGGRPDSDPFHPADALDGDPVAELGKVLSQVAEAYAALSADAEQAPTPLGPLPLPIAAAAAAMDAAVHAWDIAVATGQDRPLDVEPAEGIWPAAERLVDHLRESYQVFAPARPLPDGHDRAEALLAFLGRDPHWTP